MQLFHVIEGAQAILFSRGVYSQRKVFRRGDDVFAQYGAGYIKLSGGGKDTSGGTSCPFVSVIALEGEHIKFEGSFNVPKWRGNQ